MKAISAIILLTAIGAALNVQAAPLGEITSRQAEQQRRISQGIASGALTPREAARLEAREAHISRLETRMLADGRLSPGEARFLNQRLNRTSAAIYRAKHNARCR